MLAAFLLLVALPHCAPTPVAVRSPYHGYAVAEPGYMRVSRPLSGLQRRVHARSARPEAEGAIRTIENAQAAEKGGKSDKIITAAALVAGNMVGAGILALPTVAAAPGFIVSSQMLLGAWMTSATAGLLVAEAWCEAKIRGSQTSIEAMAKEHLGPVIGNMVGVGFLLYNLALLVAYISQGGAIVSSALDHPLASWGPGVFALTLGTALLVGQPSVLKKVNNAMVFVTFFSFLALLGAHVPEMDLRRIIPGHFGGGVSEALPIIAISLSFQNIVPVVAAQLEGDRKAIRQTVLLGSGIPMLMYLMWMGAVLSSIPAEVLNSGADPVLSSEGAIQVLGKVFSFAALATSFVGSTFGQVEELAARGWAQLSEDSASGRNGFRKQLESPEPLYWDQIKNRQRLLLYLLALAPPTLLAASASDLFIPALNAGGGILSPLLYGASPALMVWVQRYGKNTESHSQLEALVPGGKGVLSLVLAASVGLAAQSLAAILQHQ